MSERDILDRIDETLDDYDQWDGHSPDAARWDGDDWIDERGRGLTADRLDDLSAQLLDVWHIAVIGIADVVNRWRAFGRRYA